ncbi:hypothetical protein KIW84_034258 [Lathyrus oleraceus]|uniref:DUF7745 domain-containing protein n=1 Tax=Pisum sativum TaxID=3888 RepID=A0A9D4XY47_PEA|nr:hypothetical protein KIW84_034258 [Pisum sativum]
MPMLEEYAHLLGIPMSNNVPFSGLEEIPRSQIIADALHLNKSEIYANMMKKGGIRGLTSEFLIGRATSFSQVGRMDIFEAICVLLIYSLTLFLNIDNFVDVNTIIIFLIENYVATLLVFLENKQCLRWSQRLVSLTNNDIVWYDSVLGGLDIIDSFGEFSNVPLIGTQGGINYNPALARRQLGFPLKDKPYNIQLEGMFYKEGKDPKNLKSRMMHAWHNVHRKGRVELGHRRVGRRTRQDEAKEGPVGRMIPCSEVKACGIAS